MKIKTSFNKNNTPQLKEIILLTLPQLGLMLCHLSISMADIWCAGKIHSNLQASLGIISQINIMLVILTSFTASGCMASISQSLGAGLKTRAKHFAGLILMLAAISGISISIFAYFAEDILYLYLQLSAELRPATQIFYLTTILALPFSYLLIMINSIFRAYKKVWLPFCTLLLMAFANLLGNLSFGLGYFNMPAYGIYGIAWTTFACAVLGVCSNIFLGRWYHILGKKIFAPWKWNKKAMPYLFRIGMSSAFAQIISQLGSLTLLSIVNLIPFVNISILADMSIAMRIHSILLFPLGALNMSIVILSGYMLGADQKENLIHFSTPNATVAAIIVILPTLLLWILQEPIITFFTQDPDVQNQARVFLTFICLSTPLAVATGIFNAVFSGTGTTILSAKISILICWLVSIPLSYFLAIILDFGAYGIYSTDLAVKILHLACTLYIFKQKTWLNYGIKKRIIS